MAVGQKRQGNTRLFGKEGWESSALCGSRSIQRSRSLRHIKLQTAEEGHPPRALSIALSLSIFSTHVTAETLSTPLSCPEKAGRDGIRANRRRGRRSRHALEAPSISECTLPWKVGNLENQRIAYIKSTWMARKADLHCSVSNRTGRITSDV